MDEPAPVIEPGFKPPAVFRVIVTAEETTRTDPVTFLEVPYTSYCAMALEWGVCASGKTAAEAVTNVESALFGQGLLILDFGTESCVPKPAPEDWQRVRTSGTHWVCSSNEFREFFGDHEHRIVERCDLDMRKTELRAFNDDRSPFANVWERYCKDGE